MNSDYDAAIHLCAAKSGCANLPGYTYLVTCIEKNRRSCYDNKRSASMSQFYRFRGDGWTWMDGREDKKSNDLFYTCSLIAYIARKTKNTPTDVVKRLGETRIRHIFVLIGEMG